MLKLKDNVPLTELEKYGFEYFNGYYKYFDIIYDTLIFILSERRTIQISSDELDINVDVLYDMIADGLVDKVEEK